MTTGIQTPVTFGTIQGNVVLLDQRASVKTARRLKILSGPIISVSRCDWDLIVLGTNHACTLHQIKTSYSTSCTVNSPDLLMKLQLQIAAKCGSLSYPTRPKPQYQYQSTALTREVKRLVAMERWPTFIGVIDFRTLRLLEITSVDSLGRSETRGSTSVPLSDIEPAVVDKSERCAKRNSDSPISFLHTTSHEVHCQLVRGSDRNIDYSKVVSILDRLVDPASAVTATTPSKNSDPMGPPVTVVENEGSGKKLEPQLLQIMAVKRQPQLSQHVLGLNVDGRIFSIEVMINIMNQVY